MSWVLKTIIAYQINLTITGAPVFLSQAQKYSFDPIVCLLTPGIYASTLLNYSCTYTIVGSTSNPELIQTPVLACQDGTLAQATTPRFNGDFEPLGGTEI